MLSIPIIIHNQHHHINLQNTLKLWPVVICNNAIIWLIINTYIRYYTYGKTIKMAAGW